MEWQVVKKMELQDEFGLKIRWYLPHIDKWKGVVKKMQWQDEFEFQVEMKRMKRRWSGKMQSNCKFVTVCEENDSDVTATCDVGNFEKIMHAVGIEPVIAELHTCSTGTWATKSVVTPVLIFDFMIEVTILLIEALTLTPAEITNSCLWKKKESKYKSKNIFEIALRNTVEWMWVQGRWLCWSENQRGQQQTTVSERKRSNQLSWCQRRSFTTIVGIAWKLDRLCMLREW